MLNLTYARTTQPNGTVSYTLPGVKGSLFITAGLHAHLQANGLLTALCCDGAPVAPAKPVKAQAVAQPAQPAPVARLVGGAYVLSL